MRPTALLLAIVIASSIRLSGQTAQPSENVLRAGTNEVLLDLVVHDRKKRPIRDLGPEEIRVFEDGVPVKITSFRIREANREQIAQAKPAGEAKRALPLDALRQINLVSVVFDRLSVDGRRLARQALHDFLSKPLPANTYIAVFVLDSHLDVIQPYTNDLALVERAADRATQGLYSQYTHDTEQMLTQMEELNARVWVGELTHQPPRMIDKLMLQILKAEVHITRYQQGRRQMEALESLVKGQGALLGRKTVLYFSEGLVIPQPLNDLFDSLVGLANRNNVTFYAFDVRGLRANNIVDPVSRDRELQDMAAGEWDPASVNSSFGSTQMALDKLAKDTGGFLAANSNDLRSPLKRVLEEIETYYELFYKPSSTKYDGHFRKIEVRVLRTGASAQTRSGYFAVPTVAGEPLRPYELALFRALDSRPLPHEFEFHAALIPFPAKAEQTTCAVVFEVPISALKSGYEAKSKMFTLHASLLALIKDASGQVVGKVSRDLPFEVPADKIDRFRQGVLTDIQPIDLPPGRYTIASGVLDDEALSAATRRIATVVPGNDGGLAVSGLSVLRRVDPISGEVNHFDPLQFSAGRAIPALLPSIPEGPDAKVVIFFVIYPQKSGEAPKMTIDLMQNANLLVHAEPKLDVLGQRGSIPYLATIPASALKPGNYQVLVKVRQGAKIVEQETLFDVVPLDNHQAP